MLGIDTIAKVGRGLSQAAYRGVDYGPLYAKQVSVAQIIDVQLRNSRDSTNSTIDWVDTRQMCSMDSHSSLKIPSEV